MILQSGLAQHSSHKLQCRTGSWSVKIASTQSEIAARGRDGDEYYHHVVRVLGGCFDGMSAVGVASNKKNQGRAASMALTVACIATLTQGARAQGLRRFHPGGSEGAPTMVGFPFELRQMAEGVRRLSNYGHRLAA